jgi:polysaccharide export outer membrane protein
LGRAAVAAGMLRLPGDDGVTTTNYQILPGDRVYIKADDMVALDNWIVKVTTPIERVFGGILLGAGTYNRVLNAGVKTSSTGSGTTF